MTDNEQAEHTSYIEVKGKPVYGEVAQADPLNLFNGVGFRPYNPSILLTRKGMGVIDDMRKDEQIKAATGFKKHVVLSSGWEIVSPADQPEDWEVTEFVKWNLEQYFEDTLEEALLGV